LHWLGYSPKTGKINYNSNNDIYSAFAVALNGEIESLYAGFTGTVNIDKFDLNGFVEGSFECTFEEIEGYRIITAEGKFSLPYDSYQKLQGSGILSNKLSKEIINKIK